MPVESVPAASTSEAERRTREDLAAAYRLVAHFGMDDSIYTHISARVPDSDDEFLINPYSMLFRDITASSLIKVNLQGKLLTPSEFGINPAGFTIHSAVHAARHDAACVLHTHTVAGVAVSSLACGLQPCNQWACSSMSAWRTTTSRASRSTTASVRGWCTTSGPVRER